jgi:hypothetical protein
VDEELQKVVEDRARQEQCVSPPTSVLASSPTLDLAPFYLSQTVLGPWPPAMLLHADARLPGLAGTWPPDPLAAGDASSRRRPDRVRSYTRPTSAMLPRVVPVVLRPAAGPRELCDALQRHLTLHPFMLPSLSFLTASTSMRRRLPCR